MWGALLTVPQHTILCRPREVPGGPRLLCDRMLRAGDNIVDIHATSRGRPGLQDSKVDLSLSQGLTYDRNTAKRLMEDIRKASSASGLLDVVHPRAWSAAIGRCRN